MTTHADFSLEEVGRMLGKFADLPEEVDVFSLQYIAYAWRIVQMTCSLGFDQRIRRRFDSTCFEPLEDAQSVWMRECFDALLWGGYIRPWRMQIHPEPAKKGM